MFVVLPTAPPWMVAQKYQLIDPLHRDPARGFLHIGFKGFVHSYNIALGNGNPIAAMPSLHAAFALIVPAFFLPWLKPKWLKALVLVFPVLMLTSLVYLGEHWVIDGLIGWAIVGGSFWFWNRMERRSRRQRAGRARVALAGRVCMSRLDPPRVLLDSTFIAALTDHDEPFHADAVAEYAGLLDRFERDEVLLAATSDSLRGDHARRCAPRCSPRCRR